MTVDNNDLQLMNDQLNEFEQEDEDILQEYFRYLTEELEIEDPNNFQ